MEFKKSRALTVGATTFAAALFLGCTSPSSESLQTNKPFKQTGEGMHFTRLAGGMVGYKQMQFLDEYLNGKLSVELPFSIKRKSLLNSLEIESWNGDDNSPYILYYEDIEGTKKSFVFLPGKSVEKFTLVLNKPINQQRAGTLAKGLSRHIGANFYGVTPELDLEGKRANIFKRITWFRVADQHAF